ncbi:hypothetical protein BW247_06165 [Acidihalobacter ferrooxydans]|uniref:Uncharacterized protein n=2 Tax=Acidihalobacter ferrooxydans TaxID=1765967 RepID=A0A1P8UG41_9GAMM|nr:hypothetical protein BW247_06165 [Acidihalobacter ferrooxydans]
MSLSPDALIVPKLRHRIRRADCVLYEAGLPDAWLREVSLHARRLPLPGVDDAWRLPDAVLQDVIESIHRGERVIWLVWGETLFRKAQAYAVGCLLTAGVEVSLLANPAAGEVPMSR